jgi:MoxR-like ATPase
MKMIKILETPEIVHRMNKLKKELVSKGIRVVKDDYKPEYNESSKKILQKLEEKQKEEEIKEQTKEKQKTLDSKIYNLLPKTSTQISNQNHSNIDTSIKTLSTINPDKFKTFYNFLLNSGLYISPITELQFNQEKEISLDVGGICKMSINKEAYNANLTFTMLTSLLQNTSMIYFGPPGSGKTTTSEFVLSGIYNLPLSVIHKATIYGNPELTEEKMLAFVDIISYLKNHKEVIGIREFMKTPARIIDEVNRIPSSKLSILYQVLDRGWTIYNNMKINTNPGPLFATANSADSGNYEIPPAFMDRFDIGVVVDHLNPYFIGQFTETRNQKIKYMEDTKIEPPKKISGQDIINARKEIFYKTKISDDLVNKVAHFLAELNSCDKAGITIEKKTKGNALYKKPGQLCKDCTHYTNEHNICHSTSNSLSARTISTVYAYSKALAWWRGNNEVQEDDLKNVLAFASWFKVEPTRTIIEKEDCFINDRTEMMKYLFETASKSYDEITNAFPGYKHMVKTVTDFYLNKNKPNKLELEDMMNNLHKIDSTAKFSLGIALKKMYMDS